MTAPSRGLAATAPAVVLDLGGLVLLQRSTALVTKSPAIQRQLDHSRRVHVQIFCGCLISWAVHWTARYRSAASGPLGEADCVDFINDAPGTTPQLPVHLRM